MEIISRDFALSQGLTHYFTGKPCKHGHIDIRFAKDSACKTCSREKRARLYKEDSVKSRASSNAWKAKNKEKVSEYMSEWRAKNSQKISDYEQSYRMNNAEKRRTQKENWRRSNMDHVRKYARDLYASNLEHKLSHIMRGMVSRVLKNGKSRSLGYGAAELKQRIESQFRDGMNWSNHGEWEIDHKIPVSSFIARGVTDPLVVNALSNLQPLWKRENRAKNNRYSG